MPDRTLETPRRESLWFEPEGPGVHPLLQALAEARVALIGEASHGTHEFKPTCQKRIRLASEDEDDHATPRD
jgi:erythromycin esterase-like protein